MTSIFKVVAALNRPGLGFVGRRCGFGFFRQQKTISEYSRTLCYMCSSTPTTGNNKFLKVKPVTECCRCGCSGLLHTQGEKSLVDFLKVEILEGRKAQKMTSLPKDFNGFSVEADGAELSFKKSNQLESITISMNVNHSVDTDDNMEGEPYTDEMRSKPNFDIDIKRNSGTLRFTCSFVNYVDTEEKSDVYQIDEVTMYDGEWNEKNYSVAGDILDENLYDLFMSILFEKGITNDFMEGISDIATYYEHSKYIELLEGIRKFSSAH